jgi:hypothetical protein
MTFGQFHERRHKYGAVPVEVDGIRFASKREANRYGELLMLERAGEIRDLVLQPSFELHAPRLPALTGGSRPTESYAFLVVGVYRADFVYATKAGTVVEDCKGFRTPLYRWKKKHVEAEYGVRIVEV